MFVYAVSSPNCGAGWEHITSKGQFSTVCDHGGSFLRVAVMTIGYGNNRLAWMNGNLLNNSIKNYMNEAICTSYGVYDRCRAGETISGWLRYYNLDGYENGKFEFQDTSINRPWNTMRTSIFIQ